VTRPTASPNHWPYREHRTLAEVWAASRVNSERLAFLDALSRQRALSDDESRELHRRILIQARAA
jgi:hypothetical protein